MKRVLVTGGGGFIGRHALLPLSAAGYEVHAVTSRLVPSRPVPIGSPREGPCETAVHWHHGDLLIPGAGEELVDRVRPSHLLHFAWSTRPGVFWATLDNLDWVAVSLALLRAFGEAGGRRAVVAGTCAEYEWRRATHCVESIDAGGTPTRPATLYGAAKHGLHVVAEAWSEQSGVALAWGRIFHVYGPHEHPDRLVSGIARALLCGKQIRCTHGQQVRDFLYAPELGAAFAALLESEATGPLNIASGRPVRVAEVADALAAVVGRPELLRLGALPADPAEPERLTADVRRMREEVGWASTVGLHEGIERTVEWWRAGSRCERTAQGFGS